MASKNYDLLKKILLALAATAVLVYFYPHPEANRFNYEEGRPWNYAKLIAPFDIPIHPDSATLIAARDTLDSRFVPIYELNQLVIDTVVSRLPDSDPTMKHRLGNELRRIYATGVVDMHTKEQIASHRLPNIRILQKNTLSVMPTAGLSSPRDVYLYLDSVITDTALHKYFLRANLQNILQPNYERNEQESRRHYEYDYLTLTADRGIILQGQAIIDKGAIISSQDFTNLRTYEHMLAQMSSSRNKSKMLMFLGQFGYVGLLMAAMMLYFFFFVPDVFNNFRALAFFYSLVVLFFLVAVGMNYFVAQGIYLAPIMIVPILVLVFFDGRTAIFVTGILSLVCAGVTAFALEFLFLQFCAASAAVFSLRELSRRSQLLRASIIIIVSYIVAYTALELLMNGSFDGFTWRMVAFLAVNGALTSMAYILMFAVERLFGFLSIVTLVELADINNPLLMQIGRAHV